MRSRISDSDRFEIVRRAKDGELSSVIADSLGLPRTTVNAVCRKVREILGMPSSAEQRSIAAKTRAAEVLRRSKAGETDREIAIAMGSTTTAVGKVRIAAAGHPKFRKVTLTADDRSEMDRRILAGESTRAVARAIGCSQRLTGLRAQDIRHLIPLDLPPCPCGKPNNHGGRCQLPLAVQATVRERIIKGDKVDHIAKDIGYSGQGLRESYGKAIIAELRAADHRCPCGKVIGHNGMCIGDGASKTVRAQGLALRDQITPLLKSGLTRNAIANQLGVSSDRVHNAARPLLVEWAAQGMKCGCGEPIDHKGVCSARSGIAIGRGREGWAKYKREARQLTAYERARARALLIKGRSDSYVAKIIGCALGPIKAMVRALEKAGVKLPDCKCGFPRNHGGGCQKAASIKATKPVRKKNPGSDVPRATLFQLRELYKTGATNRRMSHLTGLSKWKVGSIARYWLASSRYSPPPCACGRPSHHVGGCTKRSPRALDKRALAKVEDLVRQGIPPLAITTMVGSSLATICRHTVQLREQLVAEGVACGCGRPVGHRYWCSSKWDAYEMPRGHSEMPEPQRSQVTQALLRGASVADIASSTKTSAHSIYLLLRSLSDEDRADRTRAIGRRIARSGKKQGEAIMAQIQAAVPKRIDAMVRDDIVGEIFLAVMEGRIEAEQIAAAVRSFISKGLRDWQSAYGPRSLDQKLFGDSDRTVGDLIEDETTTGQIDQLELGAST